MLIKENRYTYKYIGGDKNDERVWNREAVSNKNWYYKKAKYKLLRK